MRDQLLTIIARIDRDETASTAIEYALIAAIVAITAVGAVFSFGGEADGIWDNTGTAILDSLEAANSE